jgi:hypothetical protein
MGERRDNKTVTNIILDKFGIRIKKKKRNLDSRGHRLANYDPEAKSDYYLFCINKI